MQEFLRFALSQADAMTAWEACAVVLAIAYLLLAVRESILCWYCAFASTAIFIFLFWNVSLLMESALNVYYLLMAVYGWYQWKYGGKDQHGVQIQLLGFKKNIIAILMIAVLTLVSGWLLAGNTGAAWPYVDSFTTWGSVLTTIMVAKKILDNWLYWLVIDSVSIFLYIDRELYLTALLFMVYIIIVIFGFWRWHLQMQEQPAGP